MQKLKRALKDAAMTKIVDSDLPIVVKTDASKYAVGAVLEPGVHRSAFESRKKSEREQFHPAHESEIVGYCVYSIQVEALHESPLGDF